MSLMLEEGLRLLRMNKFPPALANALDGVMCMKDFLCGVFILDIAVKLIQEDKNVDPKVARAIMVKSSSYGSEFFQDEDSDADTESDDTESEDDSNDGSNQGDNAGTVPVVQEEDDNLY